MYRCQFLLLLLSSLFIMTGCKEELPTYSTVSQGNTLSFQCLKYSVFDISDKNLLEHSFGMKNDQQCDYRVELVKYHVGKCDNPVLKSVGSDFNGYVRVEVKKGFNCYYKIQSDYKYDVNAAFERVLKRIEKEIKE